MSPNPLYYEHDGPHYSGFINLVSIESGAEILASGGVDLIESTSPSSIVAAFSVDHFNFALESIEVEAQSHLPQALGWIPGPNEDLGATSGAFIFPETGLLDGGSSTDIFYVAYADLALGEQLTFTLTPVLGGGMEKRFHGRGPPHPNECLGHLLLNSVHQLPRAPFCRSSQSE